MRGDALVRRELQSLGAERLELKRAETAGDAWSLTADTHVVAQTIFGGQPGLVRADELKARLDAAFAPTAAEALGRVSFEGRDTRAEAHRAIFSTQAQEGQIELQGPERGKARLSSGRTRVAAASIVTDSRGSRLVARERVEAGLLPGTSGPRALRLFEEGEAIHFVSQRLESSDGGNALHFTGAVRGWQGERNLSAERLTVDQKAGTVAAEGEVTTRFPRVEGAAAVSEDDYVQIRAERLDYADQERTAVYSGGVRMRMSEGWLDAQRVEVELAAAAGQIAEIRAFDTVRLEFQRSARGELEAPITGEADRAVYRPTEQLVRMYGDHAPTTVQRPGRGGGTTAGRVLAYRLDEGTLEVDSGEQGPASIRSGR
jgi:lipopolysaccharide transport protein LptA